MTGLATPPRVAIIVPCFNDGATIRDAISSIHAPTAETEVVVVDDGSTDPNTLHTLEEIEHRVRVMRQENKGPSAATMAGLQATTAPYVMRLDADDLLEPDALDVLVAALELHPDAVVAWGDVQTFGITTFRVPTAPALDPWLLTFVNCIPGAACLFRRSALVAAGGWQLRDGFEDWDLWLSFAERGFIGAYVPRVIFQYRRDDEGRQAESVPQTAVYYERLRRRHAALFSGRRENRQRSTAPNSLKVAIAIVEAVPFLPRLARIQLCELFTHLFWNGGVRMTATMAKQAAWLRLRRLRPS